MIRSLVLLLALLAAAPTTASAAPITGQASVIDGDSLEIHGTRIRLHGIDAPESRQTCSIDGTRWRCGQSAAFALADKIGSSPVSCEPKDRDRYNRVVAVCRAGGVDLNAWMVAEGLAMAYRRYSSDYISQEREAARAKIGIWRGNFVPPWKWRQAQRRPTPRAAPQTQDSAPPQAATEDTERAQECLIKGNISRNGRIYHVPGGAYYSRTRIDTGKGERWFCSEAEARAAGWRKSRR